MNDSGMNIFTKAAQIIEVAPMMMHWKCWLADKGTNLNTSPPNSTMNSCIIKIPTTIAMKR